MFHLSLPVMAFRECLDFYRDCFDAQIVLLNERTANLYVFGGQLTFHDMPHNVLGEDQRREMHFGAVVSSDVWHDFKARIEVSQGAILRCEQPSADGQVRGKLVVLDPSGNRVEINGQPASSHAGRVIEGK